MESNFVLILRSNCTEFFLFLTLIFLYWFYDQIESDFPISQVFCTDFTTKLDRMFALLWFYNSIKSNFPSSQVFCNVTDFTTIESIFSTSQVGCTDFTTKLNRISHLANFLYWFYGQIESNFPPLKFFVLILRPNSIGFSHFSSFLYWFYYQLNRIFPLLKFFLLILRSNWIEFSWFYDQIE